MQHDRRNRSSADLKRAPRGGDRVRRGAFLDCAHRTCRRVGRAVHHAGMNRAGSEQRAVTGRGDGRHGAAGRESGDIHARCIDRVLCNHLLDHRRDDRRLAGAAAHRRIEPVPAACDVGKARLVRVQDEEPFLLRQFVHVCAGREGVRILLATMDHHHQRQARRIAPLRRCPQFPCAPRRNQRQQANGAGVAARMALAPMPATPDQPAPQAQQQAAQRVVAALKRGLQLRKHRDLLRICDRSAQCSKSHTGDTSRDARVA